MLWCNEAGLQVSTDAETWVPFTNYDVENAVTSMTAVKDGSKYCLYLRGNDMTTLAVSEAEFDSTSFKIEMTENGEPVYDRDDKVDCSGNVMTLLDYDDADNVKMGKYAFANLFKGNGSLVSAPTLPATTLTERCYFQMFFDCYNLKVAPNLPATIAAPKCYELMFGYCTQLTEKPTISITTTANYWDSGMFYGCSKLSS